MGVIGQYMVNKYYKCLQILHHICTAIVSRGHQTRFAAGHHRH